MSVKQKALKTALPYTLPICAGFIFIGMSYGFFMINQGFSFWYPLLMSALIFAGSMEFITVNLLLGSFDPLYAFLLALTVNARHLFYGLSMLTQFPQSKWKRFYLIFGMCDESFSINCTTKIPENIDKNWFMIFVTLLNQIYWVAGAAFGAILGKLIHFNTSGIEFVMTALFVVIFLNQWHSTTHHQPALIGISVSALCLFLFGPNQFMLPAMLLTVGCFSLKKMNFLNRSEER